jgi:hypothetical protein
MNAINEISSVFNIGFIAIQIIIMIKSKIRKMQSSGVMRAINQDREEHTMKPQLQNVSRRDISNLLFGMSAILLALGNLALLCFGPDKTSVITTGNAASIALSLILAFSGLNILRN